MRIDSRFLRTLLALLIATAAAAPRAASAQNEPLLRQYFEGKAVVLRIDMPGTSEGVDVRVDRGGVMDSADYGVRMKRYGASLRAGDRAVVTLVKVKNDHIEFQLGGGGFGTFGDDTTTSVYIPYVEKSRREIELERRVRDENDRRVRRDLQRELDALRSERERANRRIDAEREHLEELKRERVAGERRNGGSRFNVYYPGSVPRDIRPEDLTAVLTEYVDFSLRGIPAAPVPSNFDPAALWKGMPRDEVERALGRPVQSSVRRDGGLLTTTLVFADGSERRVTADFVEDVLIRYSITSR